MTSAEKSKHQCSPATIMWIEFATSLSLTRLQISNKNKKNQQTHGEQ